MLLRNPENFPANPDVRLEHWWELGDIQQAVLTLFTTGSSWAAGIIDWRAFLVVNLPLIGKAIYSLMRKGSYTPEEGA
jgi:hypothetical protein